MRLTLRSMFAVILCAASFLGGWSTRGHQLRESIAQLDGAQNLELNRRLVLEAAHGNPKNVRALIGAGADVDAVYDGPAKEFYFVHPPGPVLMKWTALHAATREVYPEIVNVLLEAGANPNVFDIGPMV